MRLALTRDQIPYQGPKTYLYVFDQKNTKSEARLSPSLFAIGVNPGFPPPIIRLSMTSPPFYLPTPLRGSPEQSPNRQAWVHYHSMTRKATTSSLIEKLLRSTGHLAIVSRLNHSLLPCELVLVNGHDLFE